MLITNAPGTGATPTQPAVGVEHLQAAHRVLAQYRQRAVVGVGARPQLPGQRAVSRAG